MRPTLLEFGPPASPPRCDQLERAVLHAGSTGVASVSCSDWTSGEIVGALIRCGGQLQRDGQQIRMVVIGAGVAAKLGLPQRTSRLILVGGYRTVIGPDVAADTVEIAFGSAEFVGLH